MTRLSGVGCCRRKAGSNRVGLYLLVICLLTEGQALGFAQVPFSESVRASLNGRRGFCDVCLGCRTSMRMLVLTSVVSSVRSRTSAALIMIIAKETDSSVAGTGVGEWRTVSGDVSSPPASCRLKNRFSVVNLTVIVAKFMEIVELRKHLEVRIGARWLRPQWRTQRICFPSLTGL